MSTESDFASDRPAPQRDAAHPQQQREQRPPQQPPGQPPQRSTRQPAEGTDAADPAAAPYDHGAADRGGPQRSAREPAEGRGEAPGAVPRDRPAD